MPDKNPITKHLGAHIGKAAKAMERRINRNFAEANYPITLEHWIVLVHLWLKDGSNQKTLCEFAGRNKTTITRTIDSLEEMNYVVRIPDQSDRRNKLIFLTHKGRSEKTGLIEQMDKTLAEATEGIPNDQIEICKSVLNQIFFNLAEEDWLNNEFIKKLQE